MKRKPILLVTFIFLTATLTAWASPTPSPKKEASAKGDKNASQPVSKELAQSANGWRFDKGEWVHPEGYKYAKGRVLRTTARPGQSVPQPPGKLALDNPQKLPLNATVAEAAPTTKNATDKAAARARNLAPRPAPQTGSHL